MSTTDRFDGSLSSLAFKAPCRVATTANITLNGLQSIDGVTVVQDDRVLVKDQTSSVNNGIYLADSGDWVRAADFDGSFDVAKGTLINVNSGNTYTNTQWTLSATEPIVIGTTAITFTESLFTSVAALAITYRRNALYNGAFEVWQRGTGNTNCTAGARTFLADRWCVVPSGGTAVQARASEIPSGSRAHSSLQISGAAGITTVNVQQRLPSIDIPRIKRTVTFQCYINNVTGAVFTPSLLLGTPTVLDDFTAVTNRLTQALQSVAEPGWTQVSHTVDISGYTDINNGLQVELQLPNGSMLGGDQVNITEIQLAPASAVTTFDGLTFAEELPRSMHFYQKSFPYLTAPAQSAAVTGALSWTNILAGAVAGASQHSPFPVVMRTSPTVTLYSPSAASAHIRNVGTGANWTGSSATASERGLYVSGTQDAGATAGTHQQAVHWSADAEL